jgi:hypothetical protein
MELFSLFACTTRFWGIFILTPNTVTTIPLTKLAAYFYSNSQKHSVIHESAKLIGSA